MALKKQSIRKGMTILVADSPISKEELIDISQLWDERQERFFRKMLKQGGKFKINNVPYTIIIEHDPKKRSDGNRDMGVIRIPGEDGKF